MNSFEKQTLRLNSRVRHRKVGNEGVVVAMHNGNVIIVNEVGAYIVEQLKEPQSFGCMVSAITSQYEVTAKQAEQDLQAYLVVLNEQQVLMAQSDSQEHRG
jgi:hypothetical protein